MERAEFLKKWTAALRSGEFQKGEQAYFDEEKGCACTMGVGALLLTESRDAEVVCTEGLDRLFEIFPELKPWPENGDAELWHKVANKNDNYDPIEDRKPTFAEMADFLETEVFPNG